MPLKLPPDDDDFLRHVFPGSSSVASQFRREILYLNEYCKRYKGAIPSVLLTGETGVGKNYTARGISAHSQWLTLTDDERRELYYDKSGCLRLAPIALVDRLLSKEHLPKRGSRPQHVCRLATVLGPQLADDLAGSELFGHRKSSFTGASEDHPGIFGDTAVEDILLDEIGELSTGVQSKLLQFLETRTFRPIGGLSIHECQSEHRLFLATNRPLEALVQAGAFREDLYWRIQGYRIHLPPLRERRDTIKTLVYSMLQSANYRQRGNEQFGPALDPERDRFCLLSEGGNASKQSEQSTWVRVLSEEDISWCESYAWPGNVRELRQRLDLYVYYNGHCRLPEVMPSQPAFVSVPGSTEREEGVEVLVARAVHLYLRRALAGEIGPPGRPQKLLGYFQQLVKAAVYDFRSNHRLNKDDLLRLFPDAQDAVSTLGRWRPGADDNDNKLQ
jgi:Sigma-54 interaction domain